MVAWGIVSVGTAFVHTEPQYVAAAIPARNGGVRLLSRRHLLLHLLDASGQCARAFLALFLLAVPLCNSIGSPISAHILLMNNVGGLKGWQWLFVLEGAPRSDSGNRHLVRAGRWPAVR